MTVGILENKPPKEAPAADTPFVINVSDLTGKSGILKNLPPDAIITIEFPNGTLISKARLAIENSKQIGRIPKNVTTEIIIKEPKPKITDQNPEQVTLTLNFDDDQEMLKTIQQAVQIINSKNNVHVKIIPFSEKGTNFTEMAIGIYNLIGRYFSKDSKTMQDLQKKISVSEVIYSDYIMILYHIIKSGLPSSELESGLMKYLLEHRGARIIPCSIPPSQYIKKEIRYAKQLKKNRPCVIT